MSKSYPRFQGSSFRNCPRCNKSPQGTLFEYGPNPGTMIFHMQPITDVCAIPVNGEAFPFASIENHQRDELLGELERAVIVRAVRSQNGKAIGMKIRPNQMIGPCLGGRIRTIRSKRRRLAKRRILKPQASIDLVRGNVQETECFAFALGARSA